MRFYTKTSMQRVPIFSFSCKPQPAFLIARFNTSCIKRVDPFRTAIPLWEQTTLFMSSLPPKRDCSKRSSTSAAPTLGESRQFPPRQEERRTTAAPLPASSISHFTKIHQLSCPTCLFQGRLSNQLSRRS